MRKIWSLVFFVMSSWLCASNNQDQISKKLIGSLGVYRAPRVGLQPRQDPALKTLLRYIKKLEEKSIDGAPKFAGDLQTKKKIANIIKNLTSKDFNDPILVDELLHQLDGDYDNIFLERLLFEDKINILREYLDLMLIELKTDDYEQESDGYVALKDGSEQRFQLLKAFSDEKRLFRENLEKSQKKLNQAIVAESKLAELNELGEQVDHFDMGLAYNKDELLKILGKIKKAQEFLAKKDSSLPNKDLYYNTLIPKIMKKINAYNEKIRQIWNVTIDQLIINSSKQDVKDILKFVVFITNNEPPQEELTKLLSSLSQKNRAEIMSMTLIEKSELLWSLLKQKIMSLMPRLTLLGSENSYESLIEELEVSYPEAKGLVLEAALDANNDWQNLAVVEYIIGSLFADLKINYSQTVNNNFDDKALFLKEVGFLYKFH